MSRRCRRAGGALVLRDAGWGELLVCLHDGSHLTTPPACAPRAPLACGSHGTSGRTQVKVPAGWSVLCLRTDLPGCGAQGPVDIDLDGMDLRCQEALYLAAFEFAERPWPMGPKGR